jgi:MoaA/NifB/PqqE/SkfB family radical SAM enzyme
VDSPSLTSRVARHARLTWAARAHRTGTTPPLLILFVNSLCNLSCAHCFYWRSLNGRDDLTFAEIESLARELGPVENLNLSGGEPFLRPDLAEICALFVRHNRVRQIYVPTSGFFTERTEGQLRALLADAPSLVCFVCELSLDGTAGYHDRFRGHERSFANAMATYDRLAALQREDPRLRIHAISTATHDNLDEIRRLTGFLHERCPAMDHHNLALIRGDRKDPGLRGPGLAAYHDLYRHVAAVWRDREEGRFGAVVEPLLQWAKLRTLETESQYVPCTAGTLTGVVYANGDVAVCETHPPLGNLRRQSFREIWDSPAARELRARIRARECHCTNEVFLWPSVVFQPLPLLKAMAGARPWSVPPAARP